MSLFGIERTSEAAAAIKALCIGTGTAFGFRSASAGAVVDPTPTLTSSFVRVGSITPMLRIPLG